VRQVRSTPKENAGQYYSTYDVKTFFKNEKEAIEYDKALERKREENKKQEQEAKRNERKRKHQDNMENFKDYKPPESDTARLFKSGGKQYDDVPLFKLNSENIKEYSEKIFADRRSDTFTTQVISMGGGILRINTRH
jgi:hypothetical protein